jgi:hypothetical protein
MKVSLGSAVLWELFVAVVAIVLSFNYIWKYKAPLKTIQPWDFVFCQMKDEVVWDYWIWRVQYTSEDGFVLRWWHVPLIPESGEYWLHEPFKDWLMFSKVDCYRALYN